MPTVRSKPGVTVSALLSAMLLLVQWCVAVCAFADGLETWAAPSAQQQGVSNHCHQTRPDPNHDLPEPSKKNHHSCADHETAATLPVRNSLSPVGSLPAHPMICESGAILLAGQSVSGGISILDSLRSPPRIPQRSVLRI